MCNTISESIPGYLPDNFENPGSEWFSVDIPKLEKDFIIENGKLTDY